MVHEHIVYTWFSSVKTIDFGTAADRIETIIVLMDEFININVQLQISLHDFNRISVYHNIYENDVTGIEILTSPNFSHAF